MEYPPVKPHHKALHELRKDFIYEKFKESFEYVMELAGDDAFAQLEVYNYYYAIFMTMSKLEDAKQMVELSRNVAIAAGNNEQMALRLLIEAQYNVDEGKLESGQVQIEKAFSLLDESSGELFFRALRTKTKVFSTLNYEEQIRVFKEIIEKCPKKHLFFLADTSVSLAFTYKVIGAYDESEKYVRYSLNVHEKLQYKDRIGLMHSYLGTLARCRFDSKKERKYLLESIDHGRIVLEISSQISTGYGRFMALASLGDDYAELGEFPIAIKYAEEALGMARKNQFKAGIFHGLLFLGGILNKSGQYSESIRFLEEGLQYSDFIGYNKEINRIALYEELSVACGKLNLYEKGFAYSQTLFELQKGYDEKLKEGIVYHNTQLTDELHKHKLRSIEEKMQNQASLLVAQTDLLDKFRNDLRVIVRESEEPIVALKQIKEKLKELPCSQIDWAKFESQFNELYPEFRSKLAEKFPELTEMEQRIAVMVRMDLKSVDIAKLFCVTERAVEFHRLNMRKKLHLESGETLPKFLKSI